MTRVSAYGWCLSSKGLRDEAEPLMRWAGDLPEELAPLTSACILVAMAWTADDVRRVLVNPTYAGIGPFPKVVEREEWILAATRMINEIGARKFLEAMLDELDASLRFAAGE